MRLPRTRDGLLYFILNVTGATRGFFTAWKQHNQSVFKKLILSAVGRQTGARKAGDRKPAGLQPQPQRGKWGLRWKQRRERRERSCEAVLEVKSTEMSDWQQIPNLEDKLDGDTDTQKELQAVEQVWGGRWWPEFLNIVHWKILDDDAKASWNMDPGCGEIQIETWSAFIWGWSQRNKLGCGLAYRNRRGPQ